MTDYNDRRSIGIGVSIDTTSIPFRYPFFKSTADTDPILSIAIGDTIGTDSATDINNPAYEGEVIFYFSEIEIKYGTLTVYSLKITFFLRKRLSGMYTNRELS
jgi:hypothetical protein